MRRTLLAALAACCCALVPEDYEVTKWELLPLQDPIFAAREAFAALSFDGSVWVIGGRVEWFTREDLESTNRMGDVWRSNDGVVWEPVLTEAPWTRRFGHTGVVWDVDGEPAMVVLGGFSPDPTNDVWYSHDGAQLGPGPTLLTQQWYEIADQPWAARGWHATVVFRDAVWLMGGGPLNNEVWTCEDEFQTWTQISDVPWSPRAGLSAAVHPSVLNDTTGVPQETLYVLGGYTGAALNDVWRSADGRTWELVSASAPWAQRAWHASATWFSSSLADVAEPRLWLLGGGYIGNGVTVMTGYTDTWWTRDGVEWVESTSDELGESTAEWCMAEIRREEQCVGKFGMSLLVHEFEPGQPTLVLIGGDATGDTAAPKSQAVYLATPGVFCEHEGSVCGLRGECLPTGCECATAQYSGEFCENSDSSFVAAGFRLGPWGCVWVAVGAVWLWVS